MKQVVRLYGLRFVKWLIDLYCISEAVLKRRTPAIRSASVLRRNLRCIQKFPDRVITDEQQQTLVEKQSKGLWRQNSLDWLTK